MIRPLSPEESAENWRACLRYLRRYFALAMLPALAALWGAGYGQGIIEGTAACPPAHRIEGKHN